MSKSARRQYNFELPDNNTLRMPHIPGGKKTLKGGELIVDGRGNVIDTDITGGKKKCSKIKGGVMNEEDPHVVQGGGIFGDIAHGIEAAIDLAGKKKVGRPKKGGASAHVVSGGIDPDQLVRAGGIIGDIGDGIDAAASILGLGKKGMKKGGAAKDSFVGVKSEAMPVRGGIQQGALPPTLTNSLEEVPMQKAGAKEKRKQNIDHVNQMINSMEAGVKEIKKIMRKMK